MPVENDKAEVHVGVHKNYKSTASILTAGLTVSIVYICTQVRSAAVATYAMCGFSSFGTMAIMVAVWKVVDDTKTSFVAREIPRIMLNANVSCFLTACVASE